MANTKLIFFSALLAFATAVLAGSYPAFYLSSFNPITVLKGKPVNSLSAMLLRKGLVVFQFTISIVLIIAAIIIAKADTFSRMIINEQAVKDLGFASPEEAVGEKLHLNNFQGDATYEVIGVVKDFHFQDLHHPVTPYGFFLAPIDWDAYNYMIINVKGSDLDHLLNTIGGSWKRLNPNEPFEYYFLDDQFQNNYRAEQRLSSVVIDFTVLAIFISCLGLIGLAAFSAEQRIKEIGVRKVLGASVATIIMMLSKDFLKLILIAILLATPISWYIMNQWLQAFAYREPISWIVFAVAGIVAFIIAIIAIGYQAIKAAMANPVESLRNE